MWLNQENPCEAVRYTMHSSGRNPFAVGLSPYKMAKIDALASKLAGRYFHHFAWLVVFTNSSQKISTHLLTVLIVSVIVQIEQRKRDKKKELLRDPESWMFQITTHQIFQTNISYVLNNIYKVLEGDMTYDDA